MTVSWIELGKLAADIATPIVVALIGVLLLRRIEAVKSAVATQSDFREKWAEQFFECCQGFMQTIERDLALLTILGGLDNPNDDLGNKLQGQVAELHPRLSELELRIRRSVVFAPTTGADVMRTAGKCLALMGKFFGTLSGNIDEIVDAMNDFNIESRKAHAEMLGLDPVE